MIQQEFSRYLREGAHTEGAHTVAARLEARWPFEAEALMHFARAGTGWFDAQTAPHRGARVYAGAIPPQADVGAFWFDTCELVTMVLLPAYVDPADREDLAPEALERLARQSTWLAARPVARFQYGAFLDVAPIDAASFDRAQTLAGDPFAPVTHVGCGQAGAYLSWFGKGFPTESPWLAAGEKGLDLWGAPAREWAGGATFDDDYCVALSPVTLGTDPRDTEDIRDPARRMLYRRDETPADVTFRSSVLVQYGVNDRDGHVGDGPWRLGARLRRRPREG